MHLALALILAAAPPFEGDVFHGWSKDGTWLVYEAVGGNDLVELFFCQTDVNVAPSWPAQLNEADKVEEGKLSCVRFIDINKAPYQWKSKVSLPEASTSFQGISLAEELVTDGEDPGYVLQLGDKKQVCPASGLTERSRLQKLYFHPSGRWVLALIDNRAHHCALTLKPVPAKGKKK